jgi:hypothetical protein
MRAWNAALLACAGFIGLSATPASAAECFGNCGEIDVSQGISGSITPPPANGDNLFFWVSTRNGVAGGGTLPGQSGSETNGSRLVSAPFFAEAGQKISYYFNYITSDGAGFADYAWSQLRGVGGNSTIANLFTARTKPSGTIAPGLDLPDVEADLTPASVTIQPGTIFAPLGTSSGSCFSAGCGNTGWIFSEYTVQTSGTYELAFGVTNWSDTAFDSALAFDGLLLGGSVIGDGSSPTQPLLPIDIQPDGTFLFEFTVDEPEQPVFIDPIVSIGYTYEILDSSLLITEAWFGDVQDADGYQLYGWNGMTSAYDLFLGNVMAETWFEFAAPVSRFQLLGIDPDLGLDPLDTNAFVTGLKFNGTGAVEMSMKAVTQFVPGNPNGVIPEPATWAMMLIGFGAVGFSARRRRTRSVLA